MMDEKLKPCPFCGGIAILQKTEGCDYVITCSLCSVKIMDDMMWGEFGYDGKKNVIFQWNTRQEHTP